MIRSYADSIIYDTRHQSWTNVPSCHIERRTEITIVQLNAQYPFLDETFYDLFIPELSKINFLYFMPHFPDLSFLAYCICCIIAPLSNKRSVYATTGVYVGRMTGYRLYLVLGISTVLDGERLLQIHEAHRKSHSEIHIEPVRFSPTSRLRW